MITPRINILAGDIGASRAGGTIKTMFRNGTTLYKKTSVLGDRPFANENDFLGQISSKMVAMLPPPHLLLIVPK